MVSSGEAWLAEWKQLAKDLKGKMSRLKPRKDKKVKETGGRNKNSRWGDWETGSQIKEESRPDKEFHFC